MDISSANDTEHLRAEIARLQEDLRIAEAFHNVAVKERDLARIEARNAFRRGVEAMRSLAMQIDPYEEHLAGKPYAVAIDTPASLIRIMQQAVREIVVQEKY